MALKLFARNAAKKKAKRDTPASTVMFENSDDAYPESQNKVIRRISIPFLSQRPLADQLRILAVMCAIFALVAAVMVFFQVRVSAKSSAFTSSVTQIGSQSQVMAKSAVQSMAGGEGSFAQMEASRIEINKLIAEVSRDVLGQASGAATVENADAKTSQTTTVESEIRELQIKGERLDEKVRYLVSQRDIIHSVAQAIQAADRQDVALREIALIFADSKLERRAPSAEISDAYRVAVLSQQTMKGVNGMLRVETSSDESLSRLKENIDELDMGIQELEKLTGKIGQYEKNASDPTFSKLSEAVKGHIISVQKILDSANDLGKVGNVSKRVFEDSNDLLTYTEVLIAKYEQRHKNLKVFSIAAAIAGLLALLSLAFLVIVYNNSLAVSRLEAEKQSRKAEMERKRAEFERNSTQQSILRLMNEMSELADGDLTIRATVTEDLTGAIADVVNYTIEELAVLVGQINDAAGRVTGATEVAQRLSGELLGASERQAKEIQRAGAQVQDMARQMSAVSGSALRTSSVAHHALASARKGASAVQNSIKGMNEIREQIQETSKRIKRLGESSQEIGEIVELISDITEQTNVLALNAAIQAASAGEAGRGFTIVAEEVQRLAERSAEATKQIASIVKTIQIDTQDTVAAMENSTRGVVNGAKLSDAAGQALLEIGKVSVEVTSLVEKISKDTQHQASVAVEVSESMRDILAVTEQTTKGTQQSALSIGELADLAVELKSSVSGFRVRQG